MERLRSRFSAGYGAGPLHLVALLASLAVAIYAAVRLVPENPLGITWWFLGAVVGHDLVLFPLYAVADRALPRRPRRAPRGPAQERPRVPWTNHVRVPVALSVMLLLVWAPLIFELTDIYEPITGTPLGGYLERWVAITAALAVLSAASYAWRVHRARRRPPAPDPAPRPGRTASS